MKIEIKHRISGSILFSLETDSLGAAVEEAIKSKADLSYADLSHADLSYTDLSYADFSHADLSYTNLRYTNLSYANLSYTNLRSADVSSADLSYANLRSADGKKLKLVGDRPLLIIGPLGSRSDYLHAFLTDHGLYLKTGCFFGTRDEFIEAVIKTHNDNEHDREYRAALKLIEVHADLWTPIALIMEEGGF